NSFYAARKCALQIRKSFYGACALGRGSLGCGHYENPLRFRSLFDVRSADDRSVCEFASGGCAEADDGTAALLVAGAGGGAWDSVGAGQGEGVGHHRGGGGGHGRFLAGADEGGGGEARIEGAEHAFPVQAVEGGPG